MECPVVHGLCEGAKENAGCRTEITRGTFRLSQFPALLKGDGGPSQFMRRVEISRNGRATRPGSPAITDVVIALEPPC